MSPDSQRRPESAGSATRASTADPPSRPGGDTAGDVGAPTRSSATPAGDARGQMTLDFTAGVVIFLMVIAAVFMFVPGTLNPFTQSGQDDLVTVNRVGDDLSERLLGNATSPYVLNRTCTVAFFNDNSPSYCRFEGTTVQERVGVQDRKYVNVSLRGNVTSDSTETEELLCWDEDSNPNPARLLERDDSNCDPSDELLAVGGTAPRNSSGSSVTARRIVSFNETDVSLVVEMW